MCRAWLVSNVTNRKSALAFLKTAFEIVNICMYVTVNFNKEDSAPHCK